MIRDLIEQFEHSYYDKINLVASENVSSDNVHYALQSDLNHRYAIPPKEERHPNIWEYPNQTLVRQIAGETQRLACELFSAQYADVSPLSGNQVADIMLSNLLKKGDAFISVSAFDGGHFTTDVLAQKYDLNRLDLPYKNSEVDVDATTDLVKEHNVKLLFLDASVVSFPFPVRELREAVGKDVIISYDGSQSLGIIAGWGFQSPLTEGADFLHGSTHKSLFGPQKAIIMSIHGRDSVLGAKIFQRIVPNFVSNAHPHHIAALGVALEEHRDFGAQYAKDVVANGQRFAIEASRRRIKIPGHRKGFTKNHQLVIDCGSEESATQAFENLEFVGINTNMVKVPHTNGQRYGLRCGFSEVTRRKMGGNTLVHIANLVADTIHKTRPLAKIKREIMSISQRHREIGYTHEKLAAQNLVKTAYRKN